MAARRYLEEFGVKVASNDYEVIPIIPGEKRPYGKKWQKYDGSVEGVEDWIAQGKGSFGIGIKTRHNPGVDIDVLDADVVEEIKDMVFSLAGPTLQRVGLPPKTLLAYRADEVFPKVDTGFWIDGKGRTVKVEILADGQQFVAAHIHPDTGKPYQWLDGKSVLNTPRKSLPNLTHDMATEIKEAAIKIFIDKGWVKKTNSVTRLTATGFDADDPFAAVKAKTQISDEELEHKLMLIPSSEDYETWFHIGMALYHQYDGGEQGLALWHQWSAGAANYKPEDFPKHWESFNVQQKDRQPITARFILGEAKKVVVKPNEELLIEVRAGIRDADSLEKLEKVCDTIKATEFSMTVREMLIGQVKEAFKRVTGVMPRIGVVREMTRYESKDTHAMPSWLKPWVFLQHDESLFNIQDRTRLSTKSFNMSFARNMLTDAERMEGKSVPELLPVDAAMNLYQVPVVFNHQYMPGFPSLYKMDGIDYVNSYSDKGVPEISSEYSPADRQAIAIFEHHLEHLIADPRDRRIFLDFLCFIVQNPGSRINWAILLQGAEGDGKSFFSQVLKAVIGMSNVNVIAGKQLEEKYNSWAEGAMVCFVEDVRLHGANRFDAINTLKPMITNVTVTIRRMNTNPYEVINTMNWITTSNLKDAMPVGEEDTRIFPIFTRFQTATKIAAFKAANPDYYKRLFSIISFGGALRKFMLERELSDDFDATARAPISSNRAEMTAMNRSDEELALQDCLEESTLPDFCDLLLDSGKIDDMFMDKKASIPTGKGLNRLLDHQGFTWLGRWTVNGEKRTYYSRQPEAWSSDDVKRGQEIRDYLDPEGL